MKLFSRDAITQYIQVFRNGEDISDATIFADDAEQRALVVAKDEDGRFLVEDGRPVIQELKGGIEIRLKDNAPDGVVRYFANLMVEEQMHERAASDPGSDGAG